jgi:UDP-2,4-diacetamido-2,4,6-trideoxy-beta-L-altropyranose hydrolase
MADQKVIIRVDGGNKIGLGHVSRCCALADMLRDNFSISFYTRANSGPVLDDVKSCCNDVVILNDDISYEEEADSWISVLKADEIVVLDGYNFTTYYQQKIKAKGCKLVCIDDIHAYHFVADVVINHAPGVNEKDYSVESYTQLFLGADYVLLKKLFLEEAIKTDRLLDIKQSAILICLGGADPDNVTKEVFEETISLFPLTKINVVVGAAYLHLNELKQTIKAHQQATLHTSIKPAEMLELMQQSNIAITSASTIALEYICVKGNLFLKCIADNQKEIYHSLVEKNCAYAFDLLQDHCNSNSLVDNQYKLIDGKSSQRLLTIFQKPSSDAVNNEIGFKKAHREDVDILFKWINDPEVRSQSLSANNITYEEHVTWFSKKIADRNCYLYIAYKNDIPVGMLRFDLHGDEVLINYLVDKFQRGKGIGNSIIKNGVTQFLNDSCFKGTIKAVVKSSNTASLKIFEKAGFKKDDEAPGIIQFKMFWNAK